MSTNRTHRAVIAAYELRHAAQTVLDAANAEDVIDEALYAELRRLADRLDTLSTVITEEAGL